MRARRSTQLALLAAATLALGCTGADPSAAGPAKPPKFDYPLDDVLRLNHLQAKGTHNSYHVKPSVDIVEWRYSHAPLDVQLATQGVRKVELDTYWNDAELVFEVYHFPGLDEQTTCRRFTECLSALKGWSDAFPAHHAIFVQIEPKDAFYESTADAYWEALEGEILSVWPRERVLTPDDVRGGAASVREALTTTGWPTLGEARGKIVFFMDESGPFREHYTHGLSDLDGRLLFVDGDAGSPAPFDAIYVLNDPIGDAPAITEAVTAGFIVRTRADSDSVEPLAGDTTRRDAALAGGAQLVSTDYPAPSDIDYVVKIPGGTPSRCNPIAAPPECTSEAIENPAFFEATNLR